MAGLEGQTLGAYEVLSKLGQGGMGAVYKARDHRLQRFVAIKILPAQLATDEEFVQRFQREAISAAQFCHSNLVQVFDIGESNQLHFIVMELVEGESLGHRLQRKGRMAASEAIAVTTYVAQALAYAWNKARLIHRDIKPANIFLSSAGEVKLGDLGLAKSLADAAGGLTMSGVVMGTPHYMSPEQGRADKQIDCRSDIYSLGCVLYHMLAGEPPYQGDSTASLIYKHVHEPLPSLRAAAPDCPEELAATVDWMMAKKPEDRPQTYEELLAELAAVRHALLYAATAPQAASTEAPPVSAPSQASVTMAEKKTPAASASKSPSFALLMTGTVVVSLLVLGLFLWSPWKPRAPHSPGASTAQAAGLEPGAIRLWDTPDKIPDKPDVRLENSMLALGGANSTPLLTAMPVSRDASIRAEVQFIPGTRPNIGLRRQGSSYGEFYRIILFTKGQPGPRIGLEYVTNGLPRSVGDWPIPQAHSAGEWVRLELRAIGNELTALADGQLLCSIHDDKIMTPGMAVVGNNQPLKASFRNIVYVPLDKPGSVGERPDTAHGTSGAQTTTAAPVHFSPSTEPWVDALTSPRLQTEGVKLTAKGLEYNDDIGLHSLGIRDWQAKDYAIRIIAKGTKKHPLATPYIYLRRTPGSRNNAYSVHLDGSAKNEIHVGFYDKTNKHKLKALPLPREVQPLESYELEARVVGNKISVCFNGALIGSVEDDELPKGFPEVQGFGIVAMQFLELPAGPAASALGAPQPASDPAWQNAINLLALIDPQKDIVSGQWTQEGTSWISDATGSLKGGAALLQLPYQPPEEYDYRLTFTRLAGDGSIMQIVSRAGKNFGWVLRAERTFMGFERAGNKRSWSENPSAVRVPNALPVGSRHISLVQVRKNGLTAYLDGQLVVRWPTDYTDFMGAPNQLRDSTLLGLGSWQNPVIFHSAEIREVTGQGVFTRPPPPATGARIKRE